MFLGLILLSFTSLSAQITVSPTYPDTSTFLWGNTSVNAVGQAFFVSGTGYGYRYILPNNFDPTVKYPVIIYLHGSDECGSDNNAQLAAGSNTAHGALALVSTANPDNQTNFPCFFIAPQAPVNETWSDDAAATAIQNLLNIFKTQYPNSFDTSRIYVTGNSMGGDGAYDLPYALAQSTHLGANPFAAAVPMSCRIGYYDGRQPATEPNISLWVFHGVDDASTPITQSDDVDVATLRALGFSIVYSRYATGPHDIWELAYQHPQLLPWLFSQKLGQPTQGLSNFAITGASQPGGATLSLSGTASTAEGFTGLTWADTTNGQSGTVSGAFTPTWSIPSIPITTSSDLIQVTAQAPNNTALVYGVATDYGGTLTVNLPYAASTTSPITNVALNKPVTVSSVDGPAHAGNLAVDGNTTTRWSSAYSDPQWIVVDLGTYYNISEITLNWEVACGKNYLIQTSNDDISWTTQTTVTGNTATGLLTYSYATPVTARYVRIYGTARATTWGYSLYELAVYGELSTNPPPPPTLTNVALDKTVTVSSVDSTAHGGSLAVDGNATTRWSSAFSDPQWIVVDLGSNYDISEITLNWEVACGKNYLIQTSTDGASWTTQTTVTGNTARGLLAYSYAVPATGRYVRVYGTARATIWGYSLYELAVYGQLSAVQPPPPPTLTNVALNKTVTVSSTDGNVGANAVDGNTTTRWSSAYSDPQWIVVNLGNTYAISEITLNWETACGKNYLIQTSTDDVNWTTQTNVTGNTTSGLLQYPYATPISARYVRMYGTARATTWGYSLWELSVYGQ